MNKFNLIALLGIMLSLGLFLTPISTMADTNNIVIALKEPTSSLVAPDPLQVRIHTLSNGMKLYMSVNEAEPRIMTNIAVRAGSKHDPASATGLAHYLEHMMFKGGPKIATLDWDKEKILLDDIAALYEKRRQENDPKKRDELYSEIDKKSNEAAKYVAANEYDKLVGSIGAKGTNAYTWVEQTVYVNDIPSNELEKWMMLESERFRSVALRLFHTELETVYEEYNINQDKDFRKSLKAISESLFPSHPYGTQTTIGKGEHLKNPSHYEIQKYFNSYYVPNNMAIIMAGDFDPNMAIKFAEKYFGNYVQKDIPKWRFEAQNDLSNRIRKDVYGQESPYLDLAWRTGGANSKDKLVVELLKGIMYNRQAGIMDLDINKKQKLLEADAWYSSYEDYGSFGLSGKPKEGQSLEEVEQILLSALEKVSTGNFEDWLLPAVIKDLKLNDLRAEKSNNARVYKMTNAFILGTPWGKLVNKYELLSNITKQEIVDYVKKQIRADNFVAVYKHTGDDPNIEKVEKPEITPVDLVRDQKSQFAEEWMNVNSPSLEPVFIDFKKDLEKTSIHNGDVELFRIQNSNGYFNMIMSFEMGKSSDKYLSLAMAYLQYLGTGNQSAEDIQIEMFKKGLEFNSYSQAERIYLTLGGLEESLDDGLKLLEDLLSEIQPDENALVNLKQDIQTKRENRKLDKRTILRSGVYNFAKYGKDSPFSYVLSEKELEAVSAERLVSVLKSLKSYKHKIFFYGSKDLSSLKEKLEMSIDLPEQLKEPKENKTFVERETTGKKVFFVNFPMVQVEVMLLSKGNDSFSLEEYVKSNLYNTYFGFGLSSIVFQEIREAKALAYSAYAYNANPRTQDKPHYMNAYVGTQADKMPEAIAELKRIIEDMPLVEEQIEVARQSILKKIQTDRIIESSIYWTYQDNKQLGYDRDLRKDIYEYVENADADDLVKFHQETIKGRKFDLLVMGDKEKLDMDYLKSQGELVELTLEEVFGY